VLIIVFCRFDKLAETLKWCLDLGVKEVTVYAFSIENFKRSKEEVECLLNLAREKFKKLIEEEEKLMQEGVNIRVIGNLSLLPEDLVSLIARAVCMTKDNNKARLNVAFAYTSRDEMTSAASELATACTESRLEPSDVSPEVIEAALYTENSLPLDMIVRTSGELRLSDFLLWQGSSCYIHFTNTLWPDFTIWDLLSAVFHYQRAKPSIPRPNFSSLSSTAAEALKDLHKKRYLYLEERSVKSQNDQKTVPVRA